MGLQFYTKRAGVEEFVTSLTYSTFELLCQMLEALNGGTDAGLERFFTIRHEDAVFIEPDECAALAVVFRRLLPWPAHPTPPDEVDDAAGEREYDYTRDDAKAGSARRPGTETTNAGGTLMITRRGRSRGDWLNKIQYFAGVFERCDREGSLFIAG
jgi:hypothetical protein